MCIPYGNGQEYYGLQLKSFVINSFFLSIKINYLPAGLNH